MLNAKLIFSRARIISDSQQITGTGSLRHSGRGARLSILDRRSAAAAPCTGTMATAPAFCRRRTWAVLSCLTSALFVCRQETWWHAHFDYTGYGSSTRYAADSGWTDWTQWVVQYLHFLIRSNFSQDYFLLRFLRIGFTIFKFMSQESHDAQIKKNIVIYGGLGGQIL
jgi:hypothetical protein